MILKIVKILMVLLIFTTSSRSESLDTVDNNHMITFYSGVFDLIDNEDDERTSLMGLEHRNKTLYKDTIFGRFSPITGGFISGKNSIYLYTGIEAQYNLGPLFIRPSFSPGYYESGNGKKLGSYLEFKSEIRLDLKIFNNFKIGYSYSHISNNDWGDINPGANNSSFSLTTIF